MVTSIQSTTRPHRYQQVRHDPARPPIDQQTDLNDLPVCEMLYHRDNGGKVSGIPSRASRTRCAIAQRS